MITLRKLTPKDSTYFLEVNNNPDTLYWMESDKPYKSEYMDAVMRCEHISWWVIWDYNFKTFEATKIGLFTTYVVAQKVYLGIIIEEQQRKKGYTAKVFKHYLKNSDDIHMDTYLRCFKDNFVVKLYKRLGYKQIGESVEIRGREFIEMKREAK